MCNWGLRCNEINLCVGASDVLGCAKFGSSCETCALGFLSAPMPKKKSDKPTYHLSKYATIGKLVENVGWKITRPGAGSGLSAGDIITSLNGKGFNVGAAEAARLIVGFAAYTGESVVINVLPSATVKVESGGFER